jgi:hypothetical protein
VVVSALLETCEMQSDILIASADQLLGVALWEAYQQIHIKHFSY